jgi:hypothetical protein
VDLDTLAAYLRAQADADSAVAVDGEVFPSGQLDQIRLAFALAAGAHLTVHGVHAADIVGPVNGTLTVTAGTASVLGRDGVPMGLAFTAPGGVLEAVITATMAAGWGFADSFPGLDVSPFSDLQLTSARFVYSTSRQAAYPWPGDPATTIGLASGLNLLTEAAFGNFPALTALLGDLIGTRPLKCYGPFGPAAGQPLPVGTIRAPLGPGTFEFGVPPNALTLGNPAVAVRVTAASTDDPVQELDLLVQADFNQELRCSVALPAVGGQLEISTVPLPYQESIAQLIQSLPGGRGFTSYIPSELTAIFAEVGLEGFTMVVAPSPQVTYLGLSISTVRPWLVIPDVLVLDALRLCIDVLEPAGLGYTYVYLAAKAEFRPDIFTGRFDFVVGLHKQQAWEVATVSGGYSGVVSLGDIVAGLLGSPDTVPGTLHAIRFGDFGVVANRSAPGEPFTYQLLGSADAAFPVLDSALTAHLELAAEKPPGGFVVRLAGSLMFGSAAFALALDLGAGNSLLTAGWEALDGRYLGINALVTSLGMTTPPVPDNLDLDLKSARIQYNFTSKALVLTAESARWGRAALVALKAADWSFFLGLEIDRTIDLSDLPIIGKHLAGIVSLSVEQIRVLVSSPLDAAAATAINTELARLSGGFPEAPADGMSGVALAMVFNAGGEPTTVTLATPPSPADGNEVLPPAAALAVPAATPPSPQDGTVWITVQKTFGPVSVEKLGVRYREPGLQFLMNATVSVGGLTIVLLGLGAGSPLSSFEPAFAIDGLGVSYAGGPVRLSGSLYGSLTPLDFYGEFVLGAGQLQIGALGGYCEVGTHPSLFAYAVLDYPIGGPAFFFVTGLAAGFGFNRRLAIPPVEGVASFPFVQWAQGRGNPPPMSQNATGDAVRKVLSQLTEAGTVAPSVGDHWFAAGVRFTSFRLVQSFALLTVVFGTELEIALLGVSSLQLPPAPAQPVALAELQLKAAYIPSVGELSVRGQLTPRSYVLSPDCQLTGGFAFITWLSGEFAGQFVVTLGGYSPRFTPPRHYPAVSRLELNWKVTSELTVTGSLYFALTSAAVMAGGRLAAVWQSGAIRAWFEIQADFLLVFEPFHYYISASIQLGASFTVNLLFTKFTISISLGVGVEIWGPEFAGRVRVDLSIISFTIAFGHSSQSKDTTIKWDEFVGRLLTGPNPAVAAGDVTGDAAASAAVVQIVVQDGLLKRLSDEDGQLNWVVDGAAVRLATLTAIPAKGWRFSANVTLASGAPAPNTNVAIGPVGVPSGTLVSDHVIEVTGGAFEATPILGNVPSALWQTRTFDGNGVPVGLDPLNNTTVPDVATGFTLTPARGQPSHTLPIPIENLDYVPARPGQAFAWSDATAPATDPFSDQTVWDTIAAAGPATVRSQLIERLTAEGWAVPNRVDVSELASRATYNLAASPVLRLLGEQR